MMISSRVFTPGLQGSKRHGPVGCSKRRVVAAGKYRARLPRTADAAALLLDDDPANWQAPKPGGQRNEEDRRSVSGRRAPGRWRRPGVRTPDACDPDEGHGRHEGSRLPLVL